MAERKSSKTGEKGKATTAREEAPKKEGKKIIEKAKAKGVAEEKKGREEEGKKAAEKGKEAKAEKAAKEEVKEAAKSAVVKEAVKKAVGKVTERVKEVKEGKEEKPEKEGKKAAEGKKGKPAEAAKKEPATREEIREASEVFLHPLISEKAIGAIERENKITFIVKKTATKDGIKSAFEKLYMAKADKVNIIKDMKGRKKAIVKVNKDYKAEDIATKLGVI
jgi:ribosomal protein L23